MLRIIVIALLISLSACFGQDDKKAPSGDKDSGFSENTVKLSTLVSNQAPKSAGIISQAATNSQTDCNVISDIYSANGSCISPVQATGEAMNANLHKENSNIPGGVRIVGPSEFAETEGELASSVNFDLFNPTAFVTNNTLRTAYVERDIYDSLNILTLYYQVKFPVTYNAGTIKWVTLFLANYGQPFSSSRAVINAKANCGLTNEETAHSNFQNMDKVTGMSFNRGDYLFCVKDNEADACMSTDFMWLDDASNTLVSTRPESPKQSHALANEEISCSNDNGRIGFDFGNFGLYATINTTNQFALWSDYSHGEYSQQWNGPEGFPVGDSTAVPEGGAVVPYYIYYYQDCANGICGTIVEGADLNIDLVFDTTGMIFVDGMNSASMDSETNIENILSKVTTKTQWAFDKRSIANVIGFDAVDIGGIDVNPNVTVSREINNPPAGAILSCSGSVSC